MSDGDPHFVAWFWKSPRKLLVRNYSILMLIICKVIDKLNAYIL